MKTNTGLTIIQRATRKTRNNKKVLRIDVWTPEELETQKRYSNFVTYINNLFK